LRLACESPCKHHLMYILKTQTWHGTCYHNFSVEFKVMQLYLVNSELSGSILYYMIAQHPHLYD
jgi:hypothetical protein